MWNVFIFLCVPRTKCKMHVEPLLHTQIIFMFMLYLFVFVYFKKVFLTNFANSHCYRDTLLEFLKFQTSDTNTIEGKRKFPSIRRLIKNRTQCISKYTHYGQIFMKFMIVLPKKQAPEVTTTPLIPIYQKLNRT